MIAGSYRVLRPLAEGGMGVIYEVEQMATGARRALKVMHGRYAADEGLRSHFVREARLAASIPSDHVAQVVDAGLDSATGSLFIVMELLDGSTLSHQLRRRGPFAWGDALAILRQIAHALGAAHELGIVHRDLKPANVFLSESRNAGLPFTVKLLDFGIAKAVAGASEATAARLGTPTWMAPEQTTIADPIGPQADVWSFGLLAFNMLAGHHYFATASLKSVPTAAVLREVILDPLLPASARAAELGYGDRLPEGFDAWFGKCVNRDAMRRFADARLAFEALELLPSPNPKDVPMALETGRRALSVRVETPITAIETPHPSRVRRGTAALFSRAGSAPGDVIGVEATPAVRVATAPTGPLEPVRKPWSRTAFFGGAGLAVAIVATVAALGPSQPKPRAVTAAAASLPQTVAPALRLHGSNTMGAELVPALAEAFLQRRTAAKAVVRRRTAPDELTVEARDGDRIIESIEVFAHGSTTAFEDLGARRCDLGMASRRIHDDERQRLATLGDMESAASEHVVALDGIAVIVNPANPVSLLTRTQIGQLFAGDVRSWSDVGGNEATVSVHARDDRSGTYDTFKHLVLPDRPLRADAVRHESSEELSDAVAADVRALGFIGLPYVRSAKAVMVKDAAGLPLLPSRMTVSTEDYPLARRLYLYVPATSSMVARDFVDYAQSDEGQRVVRAAGFVDLLPDCDPAAARPPSAPREYQDLVRGACRLSLDFRFEHATLDLDTRGLRDLPRVVEMVGRSQYVGRGLILLGFSDATAKTGADRKTSQQRADVIAEQLRARGLHIFASRGLGSAMPVAGDAHAQDRNRRVEVWLR